MAEKIARELPLTEFTIRRYERPHSTDMRALVKRLCLSVGLLQPGDSRDSIVDVFCVFLLHREALPIEDIVEIVRAERKAMKLPSIGMAESNLRRQVRRLKDQGWIMKTPKGYCLDEHLSLTGLFSEKIRPYLIEPTLARIEEYCRAVDDTIPRLDK